MFLKHDFNCFCPFIISKFIRNTLYTIKYEPTSTQSKIINCTVPISAPTPQQRRISPITLRYLTT